MSKLSTDFPGAEALIEAGYTTEKRVADASDDELLAVPGIGPATLEKIRQALAAASEAGEPVEAETQSPSPFHCAAPLCGHLITAYPCQYCGFSV